MTDHSFETHEPVDLQVEIGKGTVQVTCTDTSETRIVVEGRDAEETRVEQNGRRIEVIGPRHRGGFFGGDSELHVVAVVPTASNVAAKTGSADVTVEGDAGSAAVKSGSGDVRITTTRGSAVVETGSGDVRLDHAQGDVRVKSGSGDVMLGHSDRTVVVSTGSGDVEIGTTQAETVVKTGSGDLRVGECLVEREPCGLWCSEHAPHDGVVHRQQPGPLARHELSSGDPSDAGLRFQEGPRAVGWRARSDVVVRSG